MTGIYAHFRGIFLLSIFLSLAASAWATHNRAGEISIEQVGDCNESLTLRATVVTYTKASSVMADRDTVTVCWGDGFCDRVPRANGPGNPRQGVIIQDANDMKFNIYVAEHTYPSRGRYVISMTDPNRNGGILNVNFPNSDQIRFHLQTTYTFPNPQFQGCNDTPVLLQPPIDLACIGKRFTHNPNAFDPDGDSLSYHFIVPFRDAEVRVPNYLFPDMISPGPMNNLSINEVTGDIVWDAPQRAGEYNLAMIIVEHRDGVPIDTIVRDMQILVEECDNEPPEVETSVDEICVIAGELLEINVSATAPLDERNQRVQLTALGGPFEFEDSPAEFLPDDNDFKDDPNNKIFRWQTTCDHISDQYYSVVFRAIDDFDVLSNGDDIGLATLKTVRIKVVAPPPEDVQAQAGSGQVTVSWALPYECEQFELSQFLGFTVWRREGSNTFPLDTCTTGLAGRGYEKLTLSPIQEMEDGRYVFLDETVERGRTYCYRILAEFAKTTTNNVYIFNIIESLPSEEACVQLSRDVPLITNVDVQTTDAANGDMRVCWSKPKQEDLDTLVNVGPYRYEVIRAPGLNPSDAEFQPIGVEFVSEYFANANDTCFVDTGLNTAQSAYSYKVRFYTGNNPEPLGTTNPASSVFLNAAGTDRAVNLSWQEEVPWENFEYIVLRQNAQGTFDTIAITSQNNFTDRNLINGEEYCYKIQSIGSYGVDGIIDPIINFSQEDCAIPRDDVAPCPPTLAVSNICEAEISCTEEELLFNTLIWEVCPEADDVAGYNVYFAPREDVEPQLITSIEGAANIDFEHKPEFGLAGCYFVTAFDANQNESVPSNVICVDNCPLYELPNTFTPNDDGSNDLFRPFPFCFIENVEFKVFNRWGQVVYETDDPNLNWNGTNLNGDELADGVYYYTCRVFERRLSGTVQTPEILSGWIELIRGE